MRDARQTVGLGDELCESDQLIRLLDHVGQPAEPLPEAERVREDRRVGDFAVEKYALARHEYVVEDHEPFRHVDPRGQRERTQVLVARSERGVDHLHPFGAHRHRTSDRIRFLAGLHRLGGDDHELVTERGSGDV